ncbi:MAG: SRPBCC family protein [Rubricoccaceae bacterium]|nr:SRPBCC family protein [Rubricoccaceae bacterium]
MAGINPSDIQILPLSQAETIPAAWYTHSAFHAFDEEHVMAKSWQVVGHMSQLVAPGDYVTAMIAGNPVVVVRDKEGDIRAFYNVCKHRGGPLATESCGHLRKGVLQCQYHGWTYLLDGSLRGVPRFDRTDLFDKKDFGLTPVHLAEWEGLLFVTLEEDPNPIDEQLGGIADRIAPQKLHSKQFHSRVTYSVACNWKVYVDNYLEGYHIPLVHPELNTMLDYRNYVTETHPQYSLQHSPLKGDNGVYNADGGDAFYYWIFPNIMLNILPGRLQVNRVIPIAADRCDVIFDYYYDDLTSPEAQKSIAEDMEFSEKVQQEDMDICEHVQRGLASRAYDKGRFSVDAEVGVYHFQCLLKEAYKRALSRGNGQLLPQ